MFFPRYFPFLYNKNKSTLLLIKLMLMICIVLQFSVRIVYTCLF